MMEAGAHQVGDAGTPQQLLVLQQVHLEGLVWRERDRDRIKNRREGEREGRRGEREGEGGIKREREGGGERGKEREV